MPNNSKFVLCDCGQPASKSLIEAGMDPMCCACCFGEAEALVNQLDTGDVMLEKGGTDDKN
jgi:hypothetical protein